MKQGESAAPVICVVGRSKVGKTTFLEKLIPELKSRGYRVATIKRHAHPGFDIDYPGKDTWRHAQAGSDHVIIAAPDKVASIRRVPEEPGLDELLGTINDVDIILTEGYKRSSKPKIEVLRAALHRQPLCVPSELIALVSDFSAPFDVPFFALDDAAGVVDLIEAEFFP
ncbi:MAG TPA: molybdopterin-guanine dinucleotide biosynthesis protein B [Chloroflexi bacterium]|nr:molybdopterin-guanine dinucleotide biosynthesis protein B [Chloroflexota bacterium]